jgi:hypothetical protein
MIELNQKVWNELVFDFGKRLGQGRTIDQSLQCFLEDYWTELDNMASQASVAKYKPDYEPEKDFVTKKYLEEKNNILWNYVYNLNREIGELRKKVNLIDNMKVNGPTPKYPNNIPPTHEYPLDWYKITAHSNAQDNQPIKGLTPGRVATTGYMQVTDAQYTPEQIEEWSKVRFTPK